MWKIVEPHETEELGLLPAIFNPADPRPAREQIEDRYAHGGGWRPYGKGKWTIDYADGGTLRYPEDPAMRPWAALELNDEMVLVYDCSIIAVVQRDGTFDVLRMD